MKARKLAARALRLGLALLIPAAGCDRGPAVAPVFDAAAGMRASFPAHAAEVLAGDRAFVAGDDGFRPAGQGRALAAVFPRRGTDGVRFAVGRLAVVVRERGAGHDRGDPGGAAEAVGGTIAYPREGGASFWRTTAGGYEEWLHLAAGVARADRVAAAWDVEGEGGLRQRGSGVEVYDAKGEAQIRVSAPRAYALSGAAVHASLAVRGHSIELVVDAGGAEALVDPAWLLIGAGAGMRSLHTATGLADGRVLVAGGYDGTSALATAAVYDPTSDTWSPAASMATARKEHTATLLPDGTVLVAGGTNSTAATYGGTIDEPIATTEIYDPAADAWSPGAQMESAHTRHTATALPSGDVLVTGGFGDQYLCMSFHTTVMQWSSFPVAEIYHPASAAWTYAASLPAPAESHVATLLADGKVLVTGGVAMSPGFACVLQDVSAALFSVYDPTSNTWSNAGSFDRIGHTATLLMNGRVLFVGGHWGTYLGLDQETTLTQLFDPVSSTLTAAASPAVSRYGHTATLLQNGTVLVAGGNDLDDGVPAASAEIYDPVADAWSLAGSMHIGRYDAQASLLANGKVLVTGGFPASAAGASDAISSEIMDPGYPMGTACTASAQCASGHCADGVCCDTACDGGLCNACSFALGATQDGTCTAVTDNGSACPAGVCQAGACVAGTTWIPCGATTDVLSQAQAVNLLPSGEVLVTATTGSASTTIGPMAAARYQPATATWVPAAAPPVARVGYASVLLTDGRVLIAGGGSPLNSAAIGDVEIYDPAADAWSSTAALPTPQGHECGAVLPDGKVIVAGQTSAVAIYDPATSSWQAAATSPNGALVLLLLPSGKVAAVSSYAVDVYDPIADTWQAGTPAIPQLVGGCALLPGGLVLRNVEDGNYSMIIYDPATDTSTTSGSVPWAYYLGLVALADGRVLVAGGNGPGTGIFDSTANTWTATTPLAASRSAPFLVQLLNGDVLAVGGNTQAYDLYLTLGSAERYPLTGGAATQGAACAKASDCASEACVGGVCCNAPCSGSCFACSVADGAYADGDCTPISGCVSSSSSSSSGSSSSSSGSSSSSSGSSSSSNGSSSSGGAGGAIGTASSGGATSASSGGSSSSGGVGGAPSTSSSGGVGGAPSASSSGGVGGATSASSSGGTSSAGGVGGAPSAASSSGTGGATGTSGASSSGEALVAGSGCAVPGAPGGDPKWMVLSLLLLRFRARPRRRLKVR